MVKADEESILQAEQRIKEETGQSHQWLAYPYGEFSDALEALVSKLGFIGIGSTIWRYWPTDQTNPHSALSGTGEYADLKDLSSSFVPLPFRSPAI
ncbi:polysaccharide deacetylase family protein [Alishewanella longhuensis]